MSKPIKINRRLSRVIVRRRSNVFGSILTAAITAKAMDDDTSVPFLHAEDLSRDKPRNYVMQ